MADRELADQLVQLGCPSEAAEEILKRVQHLREKGFGWAVVEAGPEVRAAFADHLRRLHWPTPEATQRRMEQDAAYGLDPTRHQTIQGEYASALPHDLYMFLKSQTDRDAAETCVEEAIADALGMEGQWGGSYWPDLEILWCLVDDVASQPMIDWTNSDIAVEGFQENPFDPLWEVVEAGYIVDTEQWRFVNSEGDNLGGLPDPPTKRTYDRAFPIGTQDPSGDALVSSAAKNLGWLAMILFLPHWLLIQVSPGLMGIAVTASFVIALVSLVTLNWIGILVASYIWVGAKYWQLAYLRTGVHF